jgi:acyl-coenzyme A synthetase/AMP-(fatty) acid ligase
LPQSHKLQSGKRYRDAYFARGEGAWRHGDFIEVTRRGGVIVHGRSDATLNPGGVRIGTAEVGPCSSTSLSIHILLQHLGLQHDGC